MDFGPLKFSEFNVLAGDLVTEPLLAPFEGVVPCRQIRTTIALTLSFVVEKADETILPAGERAVTLKGCFRTLAFPSVVSHGDPDCTSKGACC